MILIIRGHIRNSFDNDELLNLIKKILEINSDLKIYIHTWNIYSNNLSWRQIEINNNIITKEIIYNYFNDIKHLIHHIIIDDDSKINLIGNLDGNIGNTFVPIKGWKNYWYGKYKIINYLNENNINQNDIIINIRFDILNNSNSFEENFILNFIKNNSSMTCIKNNFIFNEEAEGIDNIYIGNINTMYKLIHYFYYNLDYIFIKNNNINNPEILVYNVNKELFY